MVAVAGDNEPPTASREPAGGLPDGVYLATKISRSVNLDKVVFNAS